MGPQCAGPLHKIGVDVSQKIRVVPAQVVLVPYGPSYGPVIGYGKHNRCKYGCRNCERNEVTTPIVVAPMPKSAFPNSLASASAVAYIPYGPYGMSQKFVEGLPLYRQEQGLQRLGFSLSRQTMANWMLAGADWLEQIFRRLKARLLKCDILHGDETPLQVLKEEGRRPQQISYMWLFRSGRDGPPIVLYDYQTTPQYCGGHPRNFLEVYIGFLHVDGYVGYEGMAKITLVGCWASLRTRMGTHGATMSRPSPYCRR